jgi:hypothetical protein
MPSALVKHFMLRRQVRGGWVAVVSFGHVSEKMFETAGTCDEPDVAALPMFYTY